MLIKDNVTIDGYSQPGSAANTNPITQTNNAVIKIALDASNANFRDMAYVYYGSLTVSDPVINNSAMYIAIDVSRERGGYDPNKNGDTLEGPYVIGERAILGIYRATNVTVKGLAFLSDGLGADYAVAVAQDYGLDTTVHDRFTYDQGTSRGFHIAGCWFGLDPATLTPAQSGAAIAAFRHRDKGTGGTRQELPNMENMTIGVKTGSANPRAQFNVIQALGATLATEGIRFKVAGNQFLGTTDTDIGRYDDTQSPSIIWGTDGDGVNDAEEGNLMPESKMSFYNTSDKVFRIAGNIFGLATDGSRPAAVRYVFDGFAFNSRTKVQFGSDFNGVSDSLEGNKVYDSLGFAGNTGATTNTAWILMRGNTLVNNQVTLPLIESALVYTNFIDIVATNAITPVISAVTTTTLTGSCGIPLPTVAKVVVDIYTSDPEGDTAGFPQGKTYRGSIEDNSALDSNPAVGQFTLNTTGLGITSATKVTITANYLKAGPSAISSIVRSGSNTTLAITNGTGPFNILRASTVTGPYNVTTNVAANTTTFADAAAVSFYRVSSTIGGQTSPFATSVLVP